MAYQPIGLGAVANDGTGDTLRAAGTKINANFTEVYSGLDAKATADQGAKADTAVQPDAAMLVVTHGTTAETARPSAGAVYWIGSVAPTNAVDGDIWHDTSVV